MSSVFARLGFNYTDANNIVELSDDTKEYLNTVPRFLEPWQQTDLADNNVGGYFVNPVANVTAQAVIVATSILSATNNVNGNSPTTSALISQLTSSSYNIVKTDGSADLFLKHTNRISGVTKLTEAQEDEIYPYYSTAMSAGQSIMYVTNQTDGIQNNAPIMGSFTSLFTEDALNVATTTANSYPQIILNSITTTIGGIYPNTYTIKTSNLSAATLQTMCNNVSIIDDTMTIRTNHDINYFRNVLDVMDEVDELRAFSSPGETQKKLINEYVGSSKLLSRINT